MEWENMKSKKAQRNLMRKNLESKQNRGFMQNRGFKQNRGFIQNLALSFTLLSTMGGGSVL